MYNRKIMALFANPKNVGIIQGASGIGQYTNQNTADVYKIYLKIEDEVIVDASFKAFCGADGIAVCSVLTDMLINKTLLQAEDITENDIYDEIGELNTENTSVADALETLRLAIADYDKKQLKLLKKQSK